MPCCLAAAVCDAGDTQIAGPGQCPRGGDCYSNNVCCSEVWCVREPRSGCAAVPTCEPGDRQLQGECPPAYSCYSRSLCGATITCLDYEREPVDPPTCEPSKEPHRSYVGASPEQCQRIDFACPGDSRAFSNACGCGCERNVEMPVECAPSKELDRQYAGNSPAQCTLIRFACPSGTKMFANDCGCGCEQPAACPDWVDCMPGPGAQNALCTDDAHRSCPFTQRVY